MNQSVPTPSFKVERAALLADDGLRGDGLARALSAQADGWFRQAASALPSGWTLLATAGYAEGALCPGSDLDVWLLHPKKAKADVVNALARELWYPFWDSGLKLSPAVHSIDSALKLAGDDVVTATTLLRLRLLAGASEPAVELAEKARSNWRKQARRWLHDLGGIVRERHDKYGEVAFLLEPNLKEGRGGLRDIHAVDWALESGVDGLADYLVRPHDELLALATPLLAARAELHRVTRRASDALLLEEQEPVAARLGFGTADELMAVVAETARTVAWVSDRFWERVEHDVVRGKRKSGRAVPVGPGLVLVDDRVDLTPDAATGDAATIVRLAAAAAHHGVLPSTDALRRLDHDAQPLPAPWPRELLDEFVALLDSGPALIPVIEGLDQHRLFERVIPQWRQVRSRPQRNPYHTYTVDRHLLVTVVNASKLVRRVSRPDLLVLGAFLHDIGKNGTGDHIEAGVGLTREIGTMLGVPDDDIATLVKLVDHHLLLAETATRRDVTDPGTAETVAAAVGDVDTLQLLQAVTEADSLATGPSAWSAWKAGLIDELCTATSSHLEGRKREVIANQLASSHAYLLERARAAPGVHLEGSETSCVVATTDRRGLFAILAGVMAAHGIEILAADAWTTEDGVALDEFRITRRTGGQPEWARVQLDLDAALEGKFDIEARIDRRARSYRLPKAAVLAPATASAEVLVDCGTSSDATILEVRAPDAPALLFRLANAIASQALDIRHAKVATLGHEVVDVFYVQDRTDTGPRKLTSGQCVALRDAVGSLLTTTGVPPLTAQVAE